MLAIGTVLKTGGEFNWSQAAILRDSVARNMPRTIPYKFRVLTNDREASDPVKLEYNLPGWWSKMELFRPEVRESWGDTLYFDLDTAIVGGLGDIATVCNARPNFTVLRDFYRSNGYGSGMMFIPAKLTEPWAKFDVEIIPEYASANLGDQQFLEKFPAVRWQDLVPRQIHSFKPAAFPGATLGGKPKDARVVCFHGKPRPWETKANHWIREYWRHSTHADNRNPTETYVESFDQHIGTEGHNASDGI